MVTKEVYTVIDKDGYLNYKDLENMVEGDVIKNMDSNMSKLEFLDDDQT